MKKANAFEQLSAACLVATNSIKEFCSVFDFDFDFDFQNDDEDHPA